MRIEFYLSGEEEERNIATFYDMVSNPFALGDEINLNVSELYPADYKDYKQEYKEKMILDNEELEKLFKRKKVKIVKEGKWVDIKVAKAPNLVIEYHCEFIS